jgi:hypothetical protein
MTYVACDWNSGEKVPNYFCGNRFALLSHNLIHARVLLRNFRKSNILIVHVILLVFMSCEMISIYKQYA